MLKYNLSQSMVYSLLTRTCDTRSTWAGSCTAIVCKGLRLVCVCVCVQLQRGPHVCVCPSVQGVKIGLYVYSCSEDLVYLS